MTAVGPSEQENVALLKDEGGGLMMETGISTISFYTGPFAASQQALRAQLALVVAANPWLAGRLVKGKGAPSGVVLQHPAEPSEADIDRLFTATAATDAGAFKLKPTGTPYTTICADMYKSKKVIVGSGSDLLKGDVPVTLLTISESAPDEFAVIFSMSHQIGDGRTYYEIFQMLQPGSSVRALQPQRLQTFSETMRAQCGAEELKWADSTSAICMYTCSMMCCSAGKPKCVAFEIDAERLAAAKAAGAKEDKVNFVSTNDILTSAFFNECGNRIGMMGMDCRGRLDGFDNDLAGNYVTALCMDDTTFATPGSVRKMLSTKPYQTTGKPLPSCCGWCCGCGKDSASFGMATNWSSFAGGLVQLEGCSMVLHLPVQNPAYVVFDLMIPFAAGPDRKGVICWTVNSDEDGLRAALPVGESISKDLFP